MLNSGICPTLLIVESFPLCLLAKWEKFHSGTDYTVGQITPNHPENIIPLFNVLHILSMEQNDL